MNEIREWIQLLFVVAGGVLAAVAFFQNLRQRRVENALKFIALFRDGLREDDMKHWDDLFRSSSELAGSRPGYYFNEASHTHESIGDYFSEGSGDGHAISRMAESLNVVCHQVVSGAADARTVYYELDQLLRVMHSWLEAVPSVRDRSMLSTNFPSIDAFFRKYDQELARGPTRTIAYIE